MPGVRKGVFASEVTCTVEFGDFSATDDAEGFEIKNSKKQNKRSTIECGERKNLIRK